MRKVESLSRLERLCKQASKNRKYKLVVQYCERIKVIGWKSQAQFDKDHRMED